MSQAPEYTGAAFMCPHCTVVARQRWMRAYGHEREDGSLDGNSPFKHHDPSPYTEARIAFSRCDHCGKFGIWVAEQLTFPEATMAPPPNPDLPQGVLKDYREAARIVSRSPRGAGALLRLCIQKLCSELGETGKDLNADIGRLVARGLRRKVQQALDAVRVIGNESVHPGVLDMRDDVKSAVALFDLVNVIGREMITEPREVDELYSKLPQSKKDAIERRDGGCEPGTAG